MASNGVSPITRQRRKHAAPYAAQRIALLMLLASRRRPVRVVVVATSPFLRKVAGPVARLKRTDGIPDVDADTNSYPAISGGYR